MSAVATIIGYAVLGAVACVLIGLAGLWVWAYFPVRFQWSKNPPSYLKTPTRTLSIDRMIGFGSRRKAKWFVGLMTVSQGVEPGIKSEDNQA